MKIEISNGELLDKISILELKLLNIKDEEKLININGQLWDIEDEIREYEKNKDFGGKFTELARSVYFTNDKRSEMKKIINLITSSNLIEEKSYE